MSFLRAFAFAGVIVPLLSQAQAPSDSLFNVDQVVEVHITFPPLDFWDTLTTYYNNDADESLMGSVVFTDATGTWSYDSITVALKGNSTYNHPGNKKSFKLDLNDFVDGQKFHGLSKLHFNNCWSDPTFLREKLMFDFCQDVGIRAPRIQYANVYLNGTHWGFYNMAEAIDKNFLDRHIDDTDGNLFKAADNFGMGGGGTDAADLKWYGTDQADYATRYELKTNEVANDWQDLLDLLDMLNNADDAYFLENFPARWKWNDLLRSLAVDNLFGNLDSYINSARNYYLYHHSVDDEWQWIHWDANMAFGSYPAMGQNALTLSPYYVATNRPLMTRIMAIDSLHEQYRLRYCEIKNGFSNDVLDPHIDSLKALIGPHVNADVNKQYTYTQFEDNIEGDITVTGGGGGGGGQQTLRGLKSFIAARNASLANTLDCSSVGVADLGVTDAVLSPNPCNDLLSIPVGGTVSVEVFDAMGRRNVITAQAGRLDVSTLAPGVHLIRWTAEGHVMQARVVKQ